MASASAPPGVPTPICRIDVARAAISSSLSAKSRRETYFRRNSPTHLDGPNFLGVHVLHLLGRQSWLLARVPQIHQQPRLVRAREATRTANTKATISGGCTVGEITDPAVDLAYVPHLSHVGSHDSDRKAHTFAPLRTVQVPATTQMRQSISNSRGSVLP